MPVCQSGKHKACPDKTDHGQHIPILRSPRSAANGWEQITPTSWFSTAVRAEAVQPHHPGGKWGWPIRLSWDGRGCRAEAWWKWKPI